MSTPEEEFECVCDFPEACGGMGGFRCLCCGGDLCICLCGGDSECYGCPDCDDDGSEDDE